MTEGTSAALEAYRRGFTPIPIRDGQKLPYGYNWTRLQWDSEDHIRASFDQWARDGASGVGLLLGERGGNLVDVDIDHPKAMRLRDYFLPNSEMQSGRPSRPRSHRWFVIPDGDEVPTTRQYKLPGGETTIELRGTGGQTVIPPTQHPEGEPYTWEGPAFGGENGPAVIPSRMLQMQVALTGFGAVLLDGWPRRGSRHEAYLALAGALMRNGDEVHTWWRRNLPAIISAIAGATDDEDGSATRVKEVMGTTAARLSAEDGRATGWPHLATIIGNDHAEQARRIARDIESISGYVRPEMRRTGEPVTVTITTGTASEKAPEPEPTTQDGEEVVSTLPPEDRNPMEERVSTWATVDLEPYLDGQVSEPEPTVLRREDGQYLFYPGRVNSLYGLSESGKTWVSLYTAMQSLSKGDRVLYIDLEDQPDTILGHLKRLGASPDDIKASFSYVHPEGPIAAMQRYKFGDAPTAAGKAAAETFSAVLSTLDPTVIIVDGMTALYGLHGHSTNDAMSTDVVTSWLKSLTRGGRSCVIVIDHTGKTGGSGSAPIGAHHKIAMVQGVAYRVDVLDRPRPGALGRVQLVIFKDRLGAIRKVAGPEAEPTIADVVIDSREEGVTRIRIDDPTPTVEVGNDEATDAQGINVLSENSEKCMAAFAGDLTVELSKRDIETISELTPAQVYSALRVLLAENRVERVGGATRGARYKLVDPSGTGTGSSDDTKEER